MRKLVLVYLMFLVFISLISGLCEEGQIDINTATLIELDDIYGIGPVKAQAIIDARPFNSVSELIQVSGIGEITLDKIIDQNLACVKDEIISNDSEIKEVTQEIIEEYTNNKTDSVEAEELDGGIGQTSAPSVIQLNTPKDIKSENNMKSLDKTDYAKYGFIGFCILIGILLILKNKRKNEREIV